ncbi:MAG: MarR family transcriptional regulator [Planctomycetota bacterium]|nr:MarR family transcriptional regulator [Planctomycetota bacterium]
MAPLQHELRKRKPFDLAEQEAYLNLLRSCAVLSADFDALFKRHGLTQAQYNVLRILRGEAAKMPSLAVAERLVTRVPDITRLVDRLEQAGLVRRERCTDDRRVVYVAITPKGLSLLGELDEPVRALHRSQLSHMSRADLKALSILLEKARKADEATQPSKTLPKT